MSPDKIFILISGTGLIIFILWFFFGPRKSAIGRTRGKKNGGLIQEVTIVVEGAYSPNEVVVKKGVPVEITFDRRETGECSEWVIFGKLKVQNEKLKVEEREIKMHLAPHAKTKVEFTPMEAGEFPFSCGMGMLHGKLIVKN